MGAKGSLKSLKDIFTDILYSISDFIYPGFCPLCGDRTDLDLLCGSCAEGLVKEFSQLRFNKNRDFPNLDENAYFDQCICGWNYTENVKKIISLMKYKGQESLCFFMGDILGGYLKDVLSEFDIIVPVPLHPTRERERTYNQSRLIASAIKKQVPRLKLSQILIRKKYTKPQAGLDSKERQDNVRDVFIFRKREDLAGKKVVIVDDVVTTGATINNCAKVIKENGAAHVCCISIARPLT